VAPAGLDRKGIIDDRPFLVGPYADKVIGFLVGAFAPFLGVVTTAVAMLVWAASGGEEEATRRRRHAVSVTSWAGLGTVVMLVLVFTIFLALVGAAIFDPSLSPSAPPQP
jgi:uncharacterized membrane protein YidH (DUF202 family)